MKKSFFSVIRVLLITLCSLFLIFFSIISIYYLFLPPISKYMFKVHLRNFPLDFTINGYFQYHKWDCDTLFVSSNGNKFIQAYHHEISPRCSESFIIDSLNKVSICSGISMDGKITNPNINVLYQAFPDANIEELSFLYANAKWPEDTDKKDNFKTEIIKDGILLTNTFWKDSLEIFKVNKTLTIKVLRESQKLYD